MREIETGHRMYTLSATVHWPDLDEGISVENLLTGKPSGESQASFKKWLEGRMKNEVDT